MSVLPAAKFHRKTSVSSQKKALKNSVSHEEDGKIKNLTAGAGN